METTPPLIKTFVDNIPGTFTDLEPLREYVFGGGGTITVSSLQTGKRYTYNLKRAKHPGANGQTPIFVRVLYGPDNMNDYVFIGTIFMGETHAPHFRWSPKSNMNRDSKPVQGFRWFLERLTKKSTADQLFAKAAVWHEGKCGRCGRRLTVPESITRGIGPECLTKMGD